MDKKQLLTIADALKRPLFGRAEVVAGSRGLARSIRWVHVLESEENAYFLNGGELILSTGVIYGGSSAKGLSFLQSLIQRQAVGLCIELGPHMAEVPQNMRDLANRHEFPIIVFHQPVRFVDITLDLHENLVNSHSQALKALERYAHDLQRLTLQTQSLPRILSRFQAIVQAQTFLLGLEFPPAFSPSLPQEVQRELSGLLHTSLLTHGPLPETPGSLPLSEQKYVLYQPVMAIGQVLAYLGLVLYERDSDEVLSLIFDYTANAMAQILLRKMFAQERSLDSESRLLEEILQNRAGTEEQLRAVLGLPSKPSCAPPFWTAILEAQQNNLSAAHATDSLFHDHLPIFRLLLTRQSFRSLLMSKGNRLYLLIVETGPVPERRLLLNENERLPLEKALRDLSETACQALGNDIPVRLGVSKACQSLAKAEQAFKEAEQALTFSLQFGSPFFEDLGVYRILLQAGREVLEPFIEDYLGPILRHDDKSGGELLRTLRVFLDGGLAKQEAAEKLFIRRQTLYHRLDKIEQLLGSNCLSSERRLSLELALRAHAWLYGTTGELKKAHD